MEIQRLIIRIWCQIWPEFKCLTWLFCWVFLLPYMYLGKKLKSAYTCPYKIDWPSAWGRWWVSTDNKRSMPKVCVYIFRSDQIRLVAQSCLTLCNPMNRSTPGLPVHHQLPEFTQTHVHRVSDAIQPSHPLSSPSPPAPNPFQHQCLFQWVNSSHDVAKVLEFQL